MTLFSGHGVVYHDDCIHMFFLVRWWDDCWKGRVKFWCLFSFFHFQVAASNCATKECVVLIWHRFQIAGKNSGSKETSSYFEDPLKKHNYLCDTGLFLLSWNYIHIFCWNWGMFLQNPHVAFMIPSLLLESLLDALPPRLYLRWYVPENATLFIVGDIDEEETIREATGRWWGRRNVTGRRNRIQKWKALSIPIGSMYGIFTYIWLIFMVNVGEYTIHGSYGIGNTSSKGPFSIFHCHC